LFKCEDERFEIDMAIESNLSTLKILEPIAEEIANLRSLEDDGKVSRFNFQLEKRNLSVIHLSAIARIYGDNGVEILELMRKNPAGSIPVIVKRLKQKDLEWRKVRQELNQGWKEIMDKNNEKSFDHRSLIFKIQDKRNYIIKNLVMDIKGIILSENGGGSIGGVSEDLLNTPGIAFGVSPSLTNQLGGMNPQLVLNYDQSEQGHIMNIIYTCHHHIIQHHITTFLLLKFFNYLINKIIY